MNKNITLVSFVFILFFISACNNNDKEGGVKTPPEVPQAEEVLNTCTSVAPITCADVQITTDGNIKLALGAKGVGGVNIVTYDLTLPAETSCIPSITSVPTSPTERSCSFGKTFSEGQRFSGTATIKYTLQGSTIPYTTTPVRYSGTVEEEIV